MITDLPHMISADSRVYLEPVVLNSPNDVQTSGPGLPFLGGERGFERVCVTLCEPAGAKLRAVMAVDAFRRWCARQPAGPRMEAEEVLHHLTVARRPLNAAGRRIALDRPVIMAIWNATTDSFYAASRMSGESDLAGRARELADAGAGIIDVGGESTRPGAQPVSIEGELARVLPVIEALADGPLPLSVDTRHGAVMAAALRAGAGLINDITALEGDPASMGVCAASEACVILMHSQGEPQTMQHAPAYDDVLLEVYEMLRGRVEACVRAGIARERIIIDPGIGFGKTVAHNLALLRGVALFHGLGLPVLVGLSRKSFIGALSANEPPEDRLAGSLAGALYCWQRGVQILRVHDTAETAQALKIHNAIAAPPAG